MKRWLILSLVVAVGFACMIFADYAYRQHIREEEEKALDLNTRDLRRTLSQAVRLRLAAVDDLKVFMLASSSLPDSRVFDRFAEGLLANFPPIRAVQYTDSSQIIRYIYPLSGNEEALNLDLKTRPAAPFVEKAIRERRAVVQNPSVTVQGSLSVVVRVPLYRENEFLGLAQGVFDISEILEEVNTNLRDLLIYQLHDATGKHFWGTASIVGKTQTVDVPVGDNTWSLTVARKESNYPVDLVLFLIWGAGSALLLSILVIVNQTWIRSMWLAQAVKEKTATLQESQARLQLSVDAAKIGLWDWDLRSNQVFYSPEWKRQIGYADDEISSDFKEWQDRVHPDDLERAAQTVQDYLAKPWPNFQNEFRFRHKDGSYCWILAQASLLLDGEGKPYRMLGAHLDITERKRTEAAIRESESRYKSLFEFSPDGILIADTESYYLDANKSICQMLGYTREELIGLHASDIVVPREIPNIDPALTEVRAKSVHSREWRFLRKDGSTFAAEVNVIALPDGNLQGTIRDITDRKLMEEELLGSKRFTEDIIAFMTDGISILDEQGVHLNVNSSLCKMTGFSVEELIGAGPPHPYWAEESYQDIEKAFQKTLKGEFENFELIFKRKNGEHFPAIVSPSMVLDEKGRARYFATVKDITLSKQAEKETRENEEFLRMALEKTETGTWDWNLASGGIVLNNFWQTLLGYDPGEQDFDFEWWKKCVHPDSFPAFEKAFNDYLEGRSGDYELEYRIKNKQGEWKWIWAVGRCVEWDEENAPLRIIGTHKDISDRKRNEEELANYREHLEELVTERTLQLETKNRELEQANLHLQEMDRLKSIFLASMSHELRTPLNSIIGFSGILLMGMAGPLAMEQKKQLKMVQNSARHLLSLINDLLDLSKIEAGKVDLNIEDFLFNELVEEVAASFLPLAEAKNLKLTLEIPRNLKLRSDKRRIQQILMNLLSNAINYSEKGSIEVVAKKVKRSHLQVEVIDTGIGISSDNLRRLFQPFQQLDDTLAKSQEGTGLGLYLCKKLCLLLKGDISVTSVYGEGSTFTFNIPLDFQEQG
ncbi:MAG: PAS domain S-box protein [SAR324 cluster bacterium]|nr:PAS domain S-box protein [SAR324 cluster bacterium]